MNDPIDDFLQQPPVLPVDAKRQEAVFAQTAALLPRRRGWRLSVAVAAAAAVALALISTYIWSRSQNDETPAPKRNMVERKDDALPVPEKPDPQPPAPKLIPVAAHPRDLEWKAFDADDDHERARLYFRAGDLFLAVHDDVDSALRCYHQAFHYCEAHDLEIAPNDNWLVMALKRDQRKEK